MIHHISRQHQCQLAQVSADRSHHHSVGECPCWQLLFYMLHVLTVPCLNFVNDLGSWKEDMIISLASNILALNQDRYLTGFGKTLGHDLFFCWFCLTCLWKNIMWNLNHAHDVPTHVSTSPVWDQQTTWIWVLKMLNDGWFSRILNMFGSSHRFCSIRFGVAKKSKSISCKKFSPN